MHHISCKTKQCIQNITNTSQKQTFANTCNIKSCQMCVCYSENCVLSQRLRMSVWFWVTSFRNGDIYTLEPVRICNTIGLIALQWVPQKSTNSSVAGVWMMQVVAKVFSGVARCTGNMEDIKKHMCYILLLQKRPVVVWLWRVLPCFWSAGFILRLWLYFQGAAVRYI